MRRRSPFQAQDAGAAGAAGHARARASAGTGAALNDARPDETEHIGAAARVLGHGTCRRLMIRLSKGEVGGGQNHASRGEE